MYNTFLKIHNIKTNDQKFLNYSAKHSPFFDNFKLYAEYLSEKNGNVVKRSNKGGSYRIALIRRSLAYEDIFNESLKDFKNMETYLKLKKLDDFPEFKQFNSNKKNFYSAAFKAYLSYITFLNEKIENEYHLSDQEILVKEENPEYKIEKRKKLIRSFNRSISVINEAKIRDNYTCQYNRKHKTFMTPQNNKFIEVHHMVPLSAQGLFNAKLDALENVICLCPNCHAKIHFSSFDIREKMLSSLFNTKKQDFKRANIDIAISDLRSLYQIVK